eukprot:m.16551 g.16551  ORF g.16551 m.16551 type:complete len:790 (-) comp6923_c1_seq1:36-2405(-)
MEQAFVRPPSAPRQISVSPAPNAPANPPSDAPTSSSRPKTPRVGARRQRSSQAMTGNSPAKSLFWRIVHGIWRTRHTRDHADEIELAKTTFRELVIYIGFIVLLSLLVFGQMTTSQFRFTNAMRSLFVSTPFSDSDARTFSDVSDSESFWLFLQGPLLAGLYPTALYNGQTLDANDMTYLLRENKLLGLPRLRQVVVRDNSCDVPSAFSGQITHCYAPYDIVLEQRGTLTPAGTPINVTLDAYNFKTESQLGGLRYWGKVSTYSTAGYAQELPRNNTIAAAIVNDLKANLWLQRGARAVFVDFTVYNPNVNLFNVIRFVFEFPASSGVVVTSRFLTLKFIRLATDWDRFVFACEIIFVVFTVYYLIEETLEIAHGRGKYLRKFWSWIDIIVVVLSFISIGMCFWRQREIDNHITSIVGRQNTYADFDTLAFWSYTFDIMAACTIFIAWIKIFKYISFNKTMTQLAETLSASAADLLGFSVMFFIVFLAYAQLGYLVLGPSAAEFHTFEESVYTLFRIILGDLNFDAIRNANRVFGPIYFISFVFFVFFILFNMFIAIINDAYRKVKLKLADAKSEVQLGGLLKRGFAKFRDRLMFKRTVVADVDHALQHADEDKDGKIDFEELKRNLVERGRAEDEVRALFEKYDIDGNRVLDEKEQKLLEKDIQQLRDSLDDEERRLYKEAGVPIPDTVTSSDLELLKRRVARLEHAIGSVVSKMDAILVKLEDMASVRGPPPAFETGLFGVDAVETLQAPGFSAPSTPQASPSTTRRTQMSKLASNEALERGFHSRA